MVSTPTVYKTCYCCGLQRPIDRFRRRRRGSAARVGRCKGCDTAYMRQYRAERRAKMLGQFVGQLRRKRNRCEKGLIGEMTRRFGGLQGLAAAWRAQFDAAAAAKPGGKFASDTLFALLRLIAAYGR